MMKINEGPAAIIAGESAAATLTLSAAAQGAAKTASAPEALFAQFLEANLYADAVKLLPAILPIRKAVWWACLCSWQGGATALASVEDKALGAAVHWVQEPTRERRAAADAAARDLDWNTTAGCCAAAAGWACHWDEEREDWSIGDLEIAARLCANAVQIVIDAQRGREPTLIRRLLAIGVDIAQDKLDWFAPAGAR